MITEIAGSGISRDIELALQVLDSVVLDGQASYLAAPISTGPRFYEALAESRVADLEGLIARIGQDGYLDRVRWPNVRDGETVARRLRESIDGCLVNTGPIFIREWAGQDYMDLCFQLIERKVGTIYFHPDWAYSSGAVKEYFFGLRLGLKLRTTAQEPLTVSSARDDLRAACERLLSLGLPPDPIAARFETYQNRLREASLAGTSRSVDG